MYFYIFHIDFTLSSLTFLYLCTLFNAGYPLVELERISLMHNLQLLANCIEEANWRKWKSKNLTIYIFIHVIDIYLFIFGRALRAVAIAVIRFGCIVQHLATVTHSTRRIRTFYAYVLRSTFRVPLHTSYVCVHAYVRQASGCASLSSIPPQSFSLAQLCMPVSLPPLPLTLTSVIVSYLRRRLSLAALSRNFKDAPLCFVIVWTLALAAAAAAVDPLCLSLSLSRSLARISNFAAAIAFETTKSALKSQSEFGIKQWNF